MQSCRLVLQGKRLTPAGLKVQGTPIQPVQILQSVSPCFNYIQSLQRSLQLQHGHDNICFVGIEYN